MDNMKVNGVNNVQPTKDLRPKKTTKVPPQAPDTFEKKGFNLDDAMKTLEASKSAKGKVEYPKFNVKDLHNLRTILDKEPEKWSSVKTMASTPFVKGSTVVDLASRKKDVLDATVPFATEPHVSGRKDKGKYTAKDISLMADLATAYGSKKLDEAKPLIKTQLSGQNVALIAVTPSLEGKADKVASKVLDMEKAMGNNLKEIVFNGNQYDTSEFVIKASTKDNQVNTELLDKNLNRQAVENMSLYQQNGTVYQIKKVNDVRNNTTSKVRLTVDEQGYPTVTHEIRVVKDKKGNVVRKEYTAPSEVNGIFDIKYVDAKGNEKVVSEGHVDKKTGITTIKKDMESLDGTRTIYSYEDDPEGNRISDYKIVDKDGKVLLNNSNTFEVVSENKFRSSKNDQQYEITVDEHDINVKDLNKPERQATISIDKQIKGNKKEILKSLKSMPGEELFKLSQSTKKLVGTKDVLESYYDPGDKSIHSGSNLFVIMHELGHARDFRDVDGSSDDAYMNTLYKSISANKDVQKTYDEEREAFNKAFPDTQRDHIDYFINKATHYGGELGGLGETIAESNALLTTPKTHELLAIRSQYLQQYFPKTIAMLDNVSNQALA
ncbi:hypothetical protein IJ843_03555 [bacterium]|nr:hypothetical protein [bacterium]